MSVIHLNGHHRKVNSRRQRSGLHTAYPLTAGRPPVSLPGMSVLFVRICAVLIGFRSLTNFAKLSQGSEAVLVFFGQILRGSDVAVPSLLVGSLMLATAAAMLKPFRWAFPLLAVYAAYVPVNLVLWTVSNPEELLRVGARFTSSTDPSQVQLFGVLGMIIYSSGAIGTTAVPAWILWKRRGLTA
jgi:hypothetical protein